VDRNQDLLNKFRFYPYRCTVTSNLLTPWSRVPLEKLLVTQLVKKFPAFCETQRFITVFTKPRNRSLPWIRCIQITTSHSTSLRSILILYLYFTRSSYQGNSCIGVITTLRWDVRLDGRRRELAIVVFWCWRCGTSSSTSRSVSRLIDYWVI